MSENSQNYYASLMKEASKKIAQLQSEIDRLKQVKTEPIAIVGLGCRFPGANDPEEFWQLLRDGKDAISTVPKDRWSLEDYYDPNPDTPGKMYSRHGGFVKPLREFDAQFFGISPREATSLDPQQRLLLEVSWEALENSAIVPENLTPKTGVFLGISTNDYFQKIVGQKPTAIDSYLDTGNSHSTASGRLSYLLGLQGPCFSVDTACSSSLVAVHLACQSLHQLECDVALAGGVNRILSPELSINFCQAHMLSPQGRCKTFDAAANGFVRAEGCGVIILKRLQDARADGDRILAVIRGSAINQDGRTSGLTVPNGPAQQAVIRQALAAGDVKPEAVSYIEAHGTGTALGDPIEMGALGAVFGQRQQPLAVGSVKSNIGHLESAAGIAGLIKVVLSLQHGEIPPSLHFQEPNPYIDWERLPVTVPTQRLPWSQEHRMAGVSSFGFSGTNAHVVLERSPLAETSEAARKTRNGSSELLTLCAKNEPALKELARRYAQYLDGQSEAAFGDICATANTGRSQFHHRLAAIAATPAEAQEKLSAFSSGRDIAAVVRGQVAQNHKIAFLFTGQGSQYEGMGRQLYETQPVFRQTLDRCDEILRPELPIPLLEILYPETPASHPQLDETAYTQPALFAIEYALFELWKSWGIEPQLVMGHSVGEYVAACVAGVFSLEDGLKLIARRGQLMQALPRDGSMVAVFAPERTVSAIVRERQLEVSIAAINGPNLVVVSGKDDAIAIALETLEARDIKTKPLKVSHAFHSALMEPMLPEFDRFAQQITYSTPTLPLISNVTGKLATDEIATPQYWCRHIRDAVQFTASMETLARQGCGVFLECGPKPILLGMGRQCLPENSGSWLPSLHPEDSDSARILQSLGELYARGIDPNWQEFYRDLTPAKVVLPNYPFQRQTYWIETTTADLPETEIERTAIVNLLDEGDTQRLTRQVANQGRFSDAEKQLLPKLVEVFVKQHQKQSTAASIRDWFYDIEWQSKARQTPQLPSDYMPAPEQIADRVTPQLARLISEFGLEQHAEMLRDLETLSVAYIVDAFGQMGWEWQLGETFSVAAIAQRLGAIDQHQRQLGRWMEILADVGLLKPVGEQFEAISVPQKQDPQRLWDALFERYPAAASELTLLQRFGSQLQFVLRGQRTALELLFPDGEFDSATSFYEKSPTMRAFNTLGQRAIATALENLPPERTVNVLEIGAGTGGTTSFLLPQLNPQQTKYVFTDIGTLFLTKAQEKFRDYPFVKYQRLDVEKAPATQGFGLYQYDLIVATNVLHATQDMTQTMRHVRQLLAPGGMLVLIEGTAPISWEDAAFGFIEGWWRFTDLELRPNHPMLSVSQWHALLRETGFQTSAAIPSEDDEGGRALKQAVIVAQASTESEPGNWLIFADTQGIGRHLAQRLEARGDVATLVFPGQKYERSPSGEFTVNPSVLADFEGLFEDAVETSDLPFEGVVHLWSLETASGVALSVEALWEAQTIACGSLLHLGRCLAQMENAIAPRLYLVTQETVPIELDRPPAIARSPFWGLGKTLALEHPEWSPMLLDLAGGTPEENADTLLAEILETPGENQIAYRHGGRYVPRLVRRDLVEPQDIQLDSDGGTYLITGGLGSLGLKVARWLGRKGAKQLVLLGRSQPTPPAREALAQLEQSGTNVLVVEADISDKQEMVRVFEDLQGSCPPLRGIVHCAGGSGSQQSIEKVEPDNFKSELQAKAIGSWILHELTQEMQLDFFICFSSDAAIWGAKSLSAYAAANSFMDGLAHYRRRLGLPAVSINWGMWAQSNLAKEEISALVQMGYRAMPPEQATEAMGYLLGENVTQAIVTNLDWCAFKKLYEARGNSQLLEEIEVFQEESLQSETVERQGIIAQLKESPSSEHHSLLRAYIQTLVAKVLRIPESQLDVQQSLSNMGLDSLMAIELRNQLDNIGVTIPLANLIQGISITQLASEVLERIGELELLTAPSPVKPKSIPSRILESSEGSSEGSDRGKPPETAPVAPPIKTPVIESDAWVVFPKANPQAKLRLICFPYAGGGPVVYSRWSEGLPDAIELGAIQLPGRSARIKEAPFLCMEPLVEALAPALVPYLDRPFAFFGHCLGCLVMFEVAHKLKAEHGLQPERLFVSGSRAPQFCTPEYHEMDRLQFSSDPNVFVQDLPEQKFLDVLQDLNFDSSQALFEDEEMRQLMLPMVRADFELHNKYNFSQKPLLDIPITAIGGRVDPYVSSEHLLGWRKHTSAEFQLKMRPGDHYFIERQRSSLLHIVTEKLLPNLDSQK